MKMTVLAVGRWDWNTITLNENPNILLVISDDWGLNATSNYTLGFETPVTPTLDALAENGLVFENAWAYPLCSPTRATILPIRLPPPLGAPARRQI